MASEIFREIAKDLRSELISQLQRKNRKDAETKAEETEKTEETNETSNQKSEPKEENDQPATEKQRQALHKFGIANVPENLTKKEAYEILNQLIGLSREGNKEAVNEIVEMLNSGSE